MRKKKDPREADREDVLAFLRMVMHGTAGEDGKTPSYGERLKAAEAILRLTQEEGQNSMSRLDALLEAMTRAAE